MTLQQIKEAHPFPWRQSMVGNQVFVYDVNNAEVPLFTMLDFVTMCSRTLAGQPA